MSEQIHLEVEHGENIGWHQWVFLGGYKDIPVSVKRDAIGRRHRSAWRDWLVLSCNNSECPARGLVRMDVITGYMEFLFPVPEEVEEAQR